MLLLRIPEFIDYDSYIEEWCSIVSRHNRNTLTLIQSHDRGDRASRLGLRILEHLLRSPFGTKVRNITSNAVMTISFITVILYDPIVSCHRGLFGDDLAEFLALWSTYIARRLRLGRCFSGECPIVGACIFFFDGSESLLHLFSLDPWYQNVCKIKTYLAEGSIRPFPFSSSPVPASGGVATRGEAPCEIIGIRMGELCATVGPFGSYSISLPSLFVVSPSLSSSTDAAPFPGRLLFGIS